MFVSAISNQNIFYFYEAWLQISRSIFRKLILSLYSGAYEVVTVNQSDQVRKTVFNICDSLLEWDLIKM